MSHHQRRGGIRFIPPKVGSIHHGTVTRIESYGCFVKFTYNNNDDETNNYSNNNNSISGLVHISQCSKMKITNVADVVSLNDTVYIKIMEVLPPPDNDDQEGGGRHYKVKLSMKYVHQDTGQDLDPDGVLMEEDLFRQRSSNNNNYNNGHQQGGRRDENVDGTGGANSILGRSLASNIGMSSAIDPGSLILKGRRSSGDGTSNNISATFNGYSLVGEDEGELPPDTSTAATANETLREDPKTPSSLAAVNNTVRPMGRGRATTLPAWMTRQDNDNNATGNDERLGSMKDEKVPMEDSNYKRRRKYDDDDDKSNSNDDVDDDRRRRKHHRKDRKQRHHRSHKRGSRKKHKRQRHSRRRSSRSRSHSYSISSDYDNNSSSSLYSRSRSRSPSLRKKKRKDKNKKKRSKYRDDGHHRRDRRDYYSSGSSRSRSRERSDIDEEHNKEKEGRSSSPSGFANVDEARAIMEKLERRQQERG